MGLPIYVDICAHTRARTTWSLLSTVSFVGGNLSELYICRSPLFNFCPVMVLQLPCRYHGLTRPLAPGLISKAVVTFGLNVRLDLSGEATTKSLSSLYTELLFEVLSKSTWTVTIQVIRGDEGVGDIPGVQGGFRGV